MRADRSNTVSFPFHEIDASNCDELLEVLNRSNGQGCLYVDMS